MEDVTDSGKNYIIKTESHVRRTSRRHVKKYPTVGRVRRYPLKWTCPRVYKTEFPTKEHIPGVGPRPSTSVKIREKKRRKRNAEKGTKEGKRSLSQPIGIMGNQNEGKKPTNHHSLPKLGFVQTKVHIFLKAVERSEPTSPWVSTSSH